MATTICKIINPITICKIMARIMGGIRVITIDMTVTMTADKIA